MSKKNDNQLKEDPRATRDTAKFQRLKDAVELQLVHPTWGCQLYRLETLGHITRQEREAGDRYCDCVEAGREALYGLGDKDRQQDRQAWDLADELLAFGRHGWKVRSQVQAVCLEERYPATVFEKELLKIGLGRLSIFFSINRTKGEQRA